MSLASMMNFQENNMNAFLQALWQIIRQFPHEVTEALRFIWELFNKKE